MKIISGKKVTINYAKTGKYRELAELAIKNAGNLLETAKLKKMAQIRDDFNERIFKNCTFQIFPTELNAMIFLTFKVQTQSLQW